MDLRSVDEFAAVPDGALCGCYEWYGVVAELEGNCEFGN